MKGGWRYMTPGDLKCMTEAEFYIYIGNTYQRCGGISLETLCSDCDPDYKMQMRRQRKCMYTEIQTSIRLNYAKVKIENDKFDTVVRL